MYSLIFLNWWWLCIIYWWRREYQPTAWPYQWSSSPAMHATQLTLRPYPLLATKPASASAWPILPIRASERDGTGTYAVGHEPSLSSWLPAPRRAAPSPRHATRRATCAQPAGQTTQGRRPLQQLNWGLRLMTLA